MYIKWGSIDEENEEMCTKNGHPSALSPFVHNARTRRTCMPEQHVQCMFVGRDENMIFKKCGGEPGTNMHSGIRQLCQ